MLFRDITSLRESKQNRLMLYTDISNRHSQYAAGTTPAGDPSDASLGHQRYRPANWGGGIRPAPRNGGGEVASRRPSKAVQDGANLFKQDSNVFTPSNDGQARCRRDRNRPSGSNCAGASPRQCRSCARAQPSQRPAQRVLF